MRNTIRQNEDSFKTMHPSAMTPTTFLFAGQCPNPTDAIAFAGLLAWFSFKAATRQYHIQTSFYTIPHCQPLLDTPVVGTQV